MESHPLYVQDMFQPITGLISCLDGDHYQLSGWGPLSAVRMGTIISCRDGGHYQLSGWGPLSAVRMGTIISCRDGDHYQLSGWGPLSAVGMGTMPCSWLPIITGLDYLNGLLD